MLLCSVCGNQFEDPSELGTTFITLWGVSRERHPVDKKKYVKDEISQLIGVRAICL